MNWRKLPIRVGDRFKSSPDSKFIYRVVEAKPFGERWLILEGKCQFHMRFVREMQTWTRLEPAPDAEIFT